MEALAKSKCFRRGHDFTGDWRMIIGLIILLTTTSFSNRQVQTGALSVHRKQNLKFDCAIPAKAESNTLIIEKGLSHESLDSVRPSKQGSLMT
jgi:hypothetical protein